MHFQMLMSVLKELTIAHQTPNAPTSMEATTATAQRDSFVTATASSVKE